VGLGVKNHLDYPLCYTENSLKATAIASPTPKHRHKTVERKPTTDNQLKAVQTDSLLKLLHLGTRQSFSYSQTAKHDTLYKE
jgi:hypothetical protein